MKKILIVFLFAVAFVFLGCKKKQEQESQTQQKKVWFATKWGVTLTKEPGSKDKEYYAYPLEELEEIGKSEKEEKDGKKITYIKLKSVTGKEGYAAEKNISQSVYFISSEGLLGFERPTLTAPSRGKIAIGAICFHIEEKEEWVNVNCSDAKVAEDLITTESYYNVWIQIDSPQIVKDPVLGQTAISISRAREALVAYQKGGGDSQKQFDKAKSELDKAGEKNDALTSLVMEIKVKYGMADSATPTPVPGTKEESVPQGQ